MVLSCRKLKTLVLIQVCILCLCHGVSSANGPTLTPIPWSTLGPDAAYSTTGYQADDGGLGSYFALAKRFIDLCLPEEIPVDKVKGILDGTVSIQEEWQGLASKFAGFAACVVIGILFFLLFPLVGCCFCCCRCCGRCGGKRLQPPEDNTKCKRLALSDVVFVMSACVAVGAGYTFASSDRLSKGIDGLINSAEDSLGDAKAFINTLHSQLHVLGDDNFGQLKTAVLAYMEKNDLSKTLADKLLSDIKKMDEPLRNINTDRQTALLQIAELKTQILKLRVDKNQILPSTGNPTLDHVDVKTTELEYRLQLLDNQVRLDVITQMLDKAEGEIRSQVSNAMTNIDLGGKLDEIHNDQIGKLLDQTNDFKISTSNNLDGYKKLIKEYRDMFKPYDQYRWYAGVGLTSFLALISALMLLAVLMGMQCGSVDDKPTERGAASNCAGIMLMAAVGLIFIFGSLLMLLTTTMYMAGSLMERYVCQSIDDLTKIEKYASEFSSGFDLKTITFNLNGNQIRTGLSALMEGCEKDQTLYTVLKLGPVVQDTLNKMQSYKTSATHHDEHVKLARSCDTTTYSSYSIFALHVHKHNTLKLLNKNCDKLAIGTGTGSGLGPTLASGTAQLFLNVNTAVQDLAGIEKFARLVNEKPGVQVSLGPTLILMHQTATGLHKTAKSIKKTALGPLQSAVNRASQFMGNQAATQSVVDNEIQSLKDTIFGFVNMYTDSFKEKLEKSVAKCSPVHSIFHAVFAEAFCRGVVDPLNGFWLALGWSMFSFMPGLIFSVKLAKHFRTMLQEDSDSDPDMDEKWAAPRRSSGRASPPLFPLKKNKIDPLDF